MITYEAYKERHPDVGLTNEEFVRFKREALADLSSACFHRLPVSDEAYYDRVLETLCELITMRKQAADEAEAAPKVASETIGNYSVSYHQVVAQTPEQLQAKTRRIIKLRLGDTGLLYRGAI
ncbi:MAG: hypothetical protein E7A50_08090 [Clostridiales bacterium]|nr:hypothetical protein [Clostridiales bacterium]